MPRPVYLVDFSVYKPPEELRFNYPESLAASRQWKACVDENYTFINRIFERSGISPTNTYLPPWINPVHCKEPKNDLNMAKKEAEMVMIGAVADVLEKTGTHPNEIDILITNCSIYCPTPSLASMLVNHFKLRRDVQSYHLGGMGCGNGVMALSLVRDLLQARPNVKALFVPAEITTYCFYPGVQKDMMVANAIFRMGGAAVLLSNQARYYSAAKYELLHNVRVHTGQDDASYKCMGWGPDGGGVNGVYLRKDIPSEAAKALEHCLRDVAPRILTWRQCAAAAGSLAARRLLGAGAVPEFVPDFTRCVDHFALHAGGFAVLKGLQAAMRLPLEKMLPSFATLRDFGNTSCSTTWYVLAYMETCQDMQQGQTVMQIGMGGGMKAGINVWRVNRDVRCVHPAWRHLEGRPVTEADLPRPVTTSGDRDASHRSGGHGSGGDGHGNDHGGGSGSGGGGGGGDGRQQTDQHAGADREAAAPQAA